jgi:hypothetical protein
MTFQPGFRRKRPKANVLIDRTLGTNIGNMTINGGLAAAFDGVTSQTSAVSAGYASGSTSWIGKTLAAARAIGKVTVYGPNNQGYSTVANANLTLNLYGKQGAAPSTATNGTLLGTLSFVSPSPDNGPRDIVSSDLTTLWDHCWISVTLNTGDQRVAELQMYAWE